MQRELARSVERELAAALHHRRVPQKVQVVRVVGSWIETLRVALRDVVFIGGGREFVGGHGVVVTADAQIDVGRHVYQVSGNGDQAAESVGSRFGPLG